MTEHKYTDEEVIKALKCCREKDCGDCPLCEYPRSICEWDAIDFALDLLHRQKAEVAFWMDAAANAKKEAFKEFAEKVKEKSSSIVASHNGVEIPETRIYQISASSLDDLVKEFTEEKT